MNKNESILNSNCTNPGIIRPHCITLRYTDTLKQLKRSRAKNSKLLTSFSTTPSTPPSPLLSFLKMTPVQNQPKGGKSRPYFYQAAYVI